MPQDHNPSLYCHGNLKFQHQIFCTCHKHRRMLPDRVTTPECHLHVMFTASVIVIKCSRVLILQVTLMLMYCRKWMQYLITATSRRSIKSKSKRRSGASTWKWCIHLWSWRRNIWATEQVRIQYKIDFKICRVLSCVL
jgi:hypothetical protein